MISHNRPARITTAGLSIKVCALIASSSKFYRQLSVERVELFNKKKRDEKFHGMRNEYELKKQLDMIERSAREAMTADRSADGVKP